MQPERKGRLTAAAPRARRPASPIRIRKSPPRIARGRELAALRTRLVRGGDPGDDDLVRGEPDGPITPDLDLVRGGPEGQNPGAGILSP